MPRPTLWLFAGNAGNPISGFADSLGDPFGQWGSGNQTVEGFFDLAGLKPPNSNGAQYQLSVEALDAKSADGAGPYSPGPVAPSGWFAPILVTVGLGGDLQQDILMVGSARPIPKAQSTWAPRQRNSEKPSGRREGPHHCAPCATAILCTYIFVFPCQGWTRNDTLCLARHPECRLRSRKGPWQRRSTSYASKATRQKTTRALEFPAPSANQSLPRILNDLALPAKLV
jgi:hypothetical protein